MNSWAPGPAPAVAEVARSFGEVQAERFWRCLVDRNFVGADTPRHDRVVLNYGLDKVGFPSPVPIGAKVRLSATLQSVEPVRGGVQVTIAAVVEISGAAKPACIAEPVYRYLQQI